MSPEERLAVIFARAEEGRYGPAVDDVPFLLEQIKEMRDGVKWLEEKCQPLLDLEDDLELAAHVACGLVFDLARGPLESECAFCRARGPNNEETIRAHLLACEKHPFSALAKEADRFRKELDLALGEHAARCRELEGWEAEAEELLKRIGKDSVRVHEGGAAENLRASLAVSVTKALSVRITAEESARRVVAEREACAKLVDGDGWPVAAEMIRGRR